MFYSPVPKMNTSQKLRILCFLFMVIVNEFPVALESHENVLISPDVMSLLVDPHLLYVSLYGPTEILKWLNHLPVVEVI